MNVDQIIDKKTVAIPGPIGDVTPQVRAAQQAAESARDTAQAYRDQAQAFAAGTRQLQDGAVASLVSDGGSLTALALRGRSPLVSLEAFGSHNDGQLTIVNIAIDGTVTKVSGDAFLSSDVGKTIGIRGAGNFVNDTTKNHYGNDGVYVSQIISVSSDGKAHCTAPYQAATNADCVYGSLDDDAFTSAFNWVRSRNGGGILIPNGITLVSAEQSIPDNLILAGQSRTSAQIFVVKLCGGYSDTSNKSNDWLNSDGHHDGGWTIEGCLFRDFTVHARFMGMSGDNAAMAQVKPLRIYGQKDTYALRLNVYDTPVTSIPFDSGWDSNGVINCTIGGWGRLGRWNSPGCAAIGFGNGGTPTNDLHARNVFCHGNTLLGGYMRPNAFGDKYQASHVGVLAESQIAENYSTMQTGDRISDNIIQSCGKGVMLGGGGGIPVTGNAFRDNGDDIAIEGGTWTACTNSARSLITGNTFTHTHSTNYPDHHIHGAGVSLAGSNNRMVTVALLVQGNQFYQCGVYVGIFDPKGRANTPEFKDISIIGNMFVGQRYLAWFEAPAASGIDFRDLIISDNLLEPLPGSNTALMLVDANVSGVTAIGNRITSTMTPESQYQETRVYTRNNHTISNVTALGNGGLDARFTTPVPVSDSIPWPTLPVMD